MFWREKNERLIITKDKKRSSKSFSFARENKKDRN